MTQRRLPELDILRAMAILLVLGRHVLIIPPELPSIIKVFFLLWRRVGWIGVDLFFVLSGFLISGLLFSEIDRYGHVLPGRFLLRRGLKIYPSFYFFLISSILFAPFFHRTLTSPKIVGELFFLQNYVGSLWNHTWSLAIEEHFYIGLVFVVFLLVGTSAKEFPAKMSWGIPFVCMGLAAVRGYLVFVKHWPWGSIHSFTHFRIDALLFGVWLSLLWHYQKNQLQQFVGSNRFVLLFVGLAFILPVFWFDIEQSPIIPGLMFTTLYLGFGILLMLVLTVPESGTKSRLLAWCAPLIMVGQHSYTIYLWHMAIYVGSLVLLQNLTGTTTFFIHVPIYLGASLVWGIVVSLLLEKPILRLRDRLFPSRSASSSA